MDLSPGTVIEGKYRIVRLLGQGGMGAVYEGANTRISRRVAIKVLHASLAGKETLVKRFEQEAKAAGLIGSEHIVDVLDIGSLPSGELFMVMEFLEGEDLGSRIKKFKRLKPYDAAGIVHQLLEGLAAAHKAGIVHRDLKPENVFLLSSLAGRKDFVKVLDFGVSKFSDLAGESMSMTSTGAVVGTPYYLSPEQARGLKNIDARSDLYSVGVVLYQSVTGRLPFNAETFNELVFKIALEEPEPAEIVVPNLDRGFAAIISRAMVRDVTGRFQSAREFQEALEQWMAMNASPNAQRVSTAPKPPPAGAVGRSGTMAMEAVDGPANWPGAPAAPQPGHGGGYYQGAGAPGMSPGAAPYGAPHASVPPGFDPHGVQAGMRSGAYAPPGAAVGYGAAPQGGYAPVGSYPGMPMGTPPLGMPGAPMMTPQAGAPMMMTPQPGALQVPISAAEPPKKRGMAVAAGVVLAVALGGGAFGAYMVFGRGDAQVGGASTTPQAPATTAEVSPPVTPTAAPSQAPAAGSASTGTEPAPTAPPSTAGAPSSTGAAPPPGPLPPATNTAGTAINPKGPVTPPGPSKTAPTTTATATPPPKPTGRVIGSDL